MNKLKLVGYFLFITVPGLAITLPLYCLGFVFGVCAIAVDHGVKDAKIWMNKQ